jgi:D-alanyl-D-alanine dipeptidase
VFALSSAFGRGAPVVKTTMPWLESTPGLSCIDDPRSTRYNRLVDVSAEPEDGRDWRTAEVMLRDDGLYDVGVLIDHNALGDGKKQVIAGRGSCVFLHIWRKKGRGTAGCTAMARWDLEKVVEWLDPSRSPVLVQLPRDEWIKRRIPWGLP